MRILSALAMLAIFTNTTAQAPPTRTVVVIGSAPQSEFEKQVMAALQARISATTRYILGSKPDAELEVSVVCIDISQVTRNMKGGICSYHFIYWPKQMPGLSSELGVPFIMSQSEAADIGEDIFEELVNASTEKKLASYLSEMKEAIRVYEAESKHR